MSNILVTGANGYIGSSLGKLLKEKNINSVAAVRKVSSSKELGNFGQVFEVGDISEATDWSKVLVGIDCIIHLAARAHVVSENERDAIDVYRRINCAATLNLATQAVALGVRRFVYVSSIGVLGNNTMNSVFSNSSSYAPVEPYAVSKMEAEIGLKEIALNTSLELVIVRPPLVYGPGAPGNFHRLLRLVSKGYPLPLGNMHAKKSMIYLENLTDFLCHCIFSLEASNKSFVIAEEESWSTVELIKLISKNLNLNTRLISIPISVLKVFATIVGQKAAINKLSTPLLIDSTNTMHVLGWKHPKEAEEGIKLSVDHFKGLNFHS